MVKKKVAPKTKKVTIPKIEEVEQPIRKQSSQSKGQANQSGA